MTNPSVAGTISPDEAGGSPSKGPPPAERHKPSKTLPTDRVQFQKQLNLLRAYAAVSSPSGRPVSISEAANVAGLNTSTVSLCNGFFADVGFLEKSPNGQYVPSAEVLAFLRAYQWNPETAAHKLQPLLRRTWFSQRLQPLLAMGAIDETRAIAELADEATAGPKYQSQLRLLLDYLEAGAVIRRDGGLIRDGGRTADGDPGTRDTASPPAQGAPMDNRETSRPSAVTTAFAQDSAGVVQFHISVKVDMGEFSGWAPERITAFFGGIAQVLAAKGKLESESGR